MLDHTATAWLKRLLAWLELFESCLGRAAQRGALRRYVHGLLSDSRRKSIEAMWARLSDPGSYQALQHFISHAPWEAERLWKQLRSVVPERTGVLILDVREWEATRDRKQREPVFRKSVLTDRGKLTFTSTTQLDPERQQLLLSERHTLVNGAGEHSRDYRFVMRCWTRTELESVFAHGGFGSVGYFGAYDPTVHAGATDRLVAVAQLSQPNGPSAGR